MTSQRKIEANRRNAQKSTGPKTKDGKARASRNALRHGLEALSAEAPVVLEKIKQIADLICGEGADPPQYQQAMIIAECQFLISCVRNARIAAIERMRTTATPSLYAIDIPGRKPIHDVASLKRAMCWLNATTRRSIAFVDEALNDADARKRSLTGEDIYVDGEKRYSKGRRLPRNDTDSMRLALVELLALERYERRALSRRHRAIRTLGAITSLGFQAENGFKDLY